MCANAAFQLNYLLFFLLFQDLNSLRDVTLSSLLAFMWFLRTGETPGNSAVDCRRGITVGINGLPVNTLYAGSPFNLTAVIAFQ